VWLAVLAASAACGGEDGDGATRSDGTGGAEPATGGGAADTGGTSTGGARTGGAPTGGARTGGDASGAAAGTGEAPESGGAAGAIASQGAAGGALAEAGGSAAGGVAGQAGTPVEGGTGLVGPPTGGRGGAAGAPSTGGSATAGAAGAPAAGGEGGEGPTGSLWTSESASILVTSWGAMNGMYWTFAATRAELSAEQLELLAGLELIEPTLPPASCDLPSFTVRITDEDGIAVSYSVTDPSCTDEPLISAASFRPFQETLGCDPFPAELFTLELEYADPVGPSRCQYQFYPGRFLGEPAWSLLRIPAPGTCRITTLGLEIDLVLYDPTATQVLASATTPGGEDAAYALDQDFTAAGDYPVSFQAVDPEETTPGSILFTCE